MGATVDREAGWSSIRRVSSLLGDHDHATPCIVEPWERRGWRKNDTSQTIDRCLVYPLPQPMDAERMLAWSEAQGGVRVAVFRTGRLADSCIGEVVIPLCDLVDSDERGPQRERRGWHELEIVDEEVPKKRKEKPALAHRHTWEVPNVPTRLPFSKQGLEQHWITSNLLYKNNVSLRGQVTQVYTSRFVHVILAQGPC